MAVVNFKSQVITDLDATPVVQQNTVKSGGTVRSAFGTGSFASSDATSVGRLIRVPSRARVTRLEFASDDLGTGGTVDVGLHAANGGAVVDADFFASAIDTDTAAVARTEKTYESAVVAHGNAGKRLWEQLGLAADPEVYYDVSVTRNTAAGTGAVSVWLEYVLDE